MTEALSYALSDEGLACARASAECGRQAVEILGGEFMSALGREPRRRGRAANA
jgi:hypothetical protein